MSTFYIKFLGLNTNIKYLYCVFSFGCPNLYFSFSKISQYSPTDTSKANERQVNRRNNVKFEPKATIEILSHGDPPDVLSEEQKKDLVHKYLEVMIFETEVSFFFSI